MFNRFLDSACGYARNDSCMQLLILLYVLKFFVRPSWADMESDKRSPASSTHSTTHLGHKHLRHKHLRHKLRAGFVQDKFRRGDKFKVEAERRG